MSSLVGIFKEVAKASGPAYKKFGPTIIAAAIVPETLPAALIVAAAIPAAAGVGVLLREVAHGQQRNETIQEEPAINQEKPKSKAANKKSNKKSTKSAPSA